MKQLGKYAAATALCIVLLICLLGAVAACGSSAVSKDYELRFVVDGRTYDIVKAGDGIVFPEVPEKAGYTFDGWFTDENEWKNPVGENAKINEDITAFAKFSIINYTITYKDEEGNVLSTDGLDLPSSYNVESGRIRLNDYYKEGFAFRGWLDEASDEIRYIYPGMTGNLVLTAVFKAGSFYNLTYVDRFNRPNENPTVYMDGDVIELQPLHKADYDFKGWSDGFNMIETLENIHGDMVLNAVWELRSGLENFNYTVDDDYLGVEGKPGYITIMSVVDNSLADVVIPDYVSMIKGGALRFCGGFIKSLTVPFLGSSYDESDFSHLGYLFGDPSDTTNKSVPAGLEELTVTGGDIQSGSLTNCSNLKKIIFGENVRSIGEAALKGCSSLEEIDLPFIGRKYDESKEYNQSEYGYRAEEAKFGYIFGNIPQTLKKVTIRKGFVYNDKDVSSSLAGLYSNNIEELDYTSANDTLYAELFGGAGEMKRITVRGDVKKIDGDLFGYKAKASEIVLPDTITEIGDGAFKNCPNLVKISVPNVTKIGASAFDGCVSLGEVVTSGNVVSIGDYAFRNCAKLGELDSGDKLVSVGNGAFENCEALYRFEIPASVTTIGNGAFKNCTGIIEVINLSSLSSVKGSDDLGGLCKYAWDVLTSADEPKKISNVDGFIVYDRDIPNEGDLLIKYVGTAKEVTIPDGIRIIYKAAFYANDNITKVVMPESVDQIGTEAFRGCVNLKTVVLSDYLHSFSEYAFAGCASLDTIDIPSAMSNLPMGVFEGCESLENITLPSSIRGIYENAFYGSGLKGEIVLPSGLEELKAGAFGGSKISRIEIPGGVATISESAFENCSELTEVVLSAGMKIIEASAFRSCGKLANINLPEGLEEIRAEVFRYCESLASVDLPKSLKVLAAGAFWKSAITSAVIPSGVTAIEDNVFALCTALNEVTLHSKITRIGKDAFRRTGITKISIPESVADFGEQAFADCENLTSFVFPSGTQSIGKAVFSGSSKLNAVTFRYIGASADDESGTLEYYFRDPFNGIPASLKSVGIRTGKIKRSMFETKVNGLGNITMLSLGSGVTEIESGSFENFTGLKGLILPFAGRTAKTVGSTSDTLEYLFNIVGYQRCETWKSLETLGVLSGEIPEKFYNTRGETPVTNPPSVKTLILGKDVTAIKIKIYTEYIKGSKILFYGAKDEYNNFTVVGDQIIQNLYFDDSKGIPRYFYSETNPFESGEVTSGNYWHFADGIVTPETWA